MFALLTFRSYPAAPAHPHDQEEVERLHLEDLHRRTARTQRAGQRGVSANMTLVTLDLLGSVVGQS